MVLPGHIAGGYIAARAVLFVAHASFPPEQTAALLVIGTLAGELPDIDLLFFYFNQRSRTSRKISGHREYITHAPLFWLVISLIIAGIGWLIGSAFVQFIGWMIWAGTWSHFILDSIEYGVRWLWPFSDRRFALRQRPEIRIAARPGTPAHHWEYVRHHYFKMWSFYAEILVTLAGIWLFLH